MAHNPRHKKRFGNLVPRTSASPLAGRFDLPVNQPRPDDELTIIEQLKLLQRRADEELAKRQMAREQRELVAGDRTTELQERKARFLAEDQRRIDERQLKREETGGAVPTLEAVQESIADAAQGIRAESTAPIPGPQGVDPWSFPGRADKQDMLRMAAKEPLYIADDGEPIYMEDVIAVGGAARLRAISGAAKPIQDAFFKMIHKLKLDRRLKGKSPVDTSKILPKVGLATTAVGAGAGAGKWMADEGLLPTFEHVGGGRFVPRLRDTGADERTPVTEPLRVDEPVPTPELDEVTRGAVTPAIVDRVAKEDKSTVQASEDLTDETRAALERTWGKWTYKPRERRDRYMEQLNSIYRKGAWLDAIAALSGNPSRSGAYIQRAVAKMEAMQMFDQEERIYNIWRDVYFSPDGAYDPPANKAEAARRARRLGASPQEVKKIYGWTEEEPDLQQWYRRVDKKLEVTTTEGKKTRPPQGDTDVDWIMGTPSDRATAKRTWNNWTDGKMTIYLPGGVSPADRGLAGDAWRKGSASESTGWAPSWKKEIGMLEKIAITDREEAITQAVSALRDEKYSHLYINQEDRREAAEHWIDEILANYAARGNIGIMETETGNNIVYGEIGF